MKSSSILFSLIVSTVFAVELPAEENPHALYLKQIKPLLTEKCISCHGPVKQESGLRLDTAKFIRKGSEFSQVVDLKTPAESEILKRVSTTDIAERMPPEGEGEALKPEQIKLLTEWLTAGMPAPADEVALEDPRDHWAYQPIEKPEIPAGDGHPIDRLLAAKQQQAGVSPYPRAEQETLLRRVSLDLVGLNPTPAERDDFLNDQSPEAYGRLVDRLLNDPRHGERWARHWMDVWRYSDWSGYKNQLRGSQRHIWRWRDWIVESLNDDKGYDRMVTEMLAGDEIAPEDPGTLRATGFLSRNFHNSNRNIWLDAAVEHTAKAFLGMTINCARCHDHKFDPIPQVEYYEMRAIFEPHHVRTERVPGERDINTDGLTRAYDQKPDEPTYLYVRGNEKQPDKEHPLSPDVPDVLNLPFEVNAIELPAMASFPSLAAHIQHDDREVVRVELVKAKENYRKVFGSDPGDKSNEAARSSGAVPPPPSLPVTLTEQEQRAELKWDAAHFGLVSFDSRWRTERRRYESPQAQGGVRWQDMARAAAYLERLANFARARVELFEKRVALEKVFSGKYADAKARQQAVQKAQKERQAAAKKWIEAAEARNKQDTNYTPVGEHYPEISTGRRSALAHWITHPDNPLTARVAVNHIWLRHFGRPLVENVFDFGLRSPTPEHLEVLDWLAAELREHDWNMKHIHRLIVTSDAYQRASSSNDAELASANLVADPDNKLYWKANLQRLEAEVIRDNVMHVAGQLDLTQGGPDIDFTKGETVLRRSLYFRHAYEKQMTMLTLFDAASPNECYRRSESILPQQALVLSNSDLALKMSADLARQLNENAKTDRAFVESAFRRMLVRQPTAEEAAACREFLTAQQERLSNPENLTSFATVSKKETALPADPKLRARANLIHVLMNHNDFVTVR